jgi:hypothetical protein
VTALMRTAWLAAVACVFVATPGNAQSLRTKVDQFYAGSYRVAPEGLVLGELVAATVLPPASTAGFDTVGDGSVGPLVTEQAVTVGAKHVTVSLRYEDLSWSPEIEHDRFGNAVGLFRILDGYGRFHVDALTLRQQRYTLSGTYGVRDDFDVELALPIADTHVDARGRAFAEGIFPGALHAGDGAIGDLLLRTKWRLRDVRGIPIALMLTASVPTGDVDDFAGRGAWTLEPSVVASRRVGPLRVDLDVGIEANTDTLEASRARYRLAGSIAFLHRLGLSAEVDARTAFSEYDSRADAPRNFVVGTFGFPSYAVTFPRMDLADALVTLHARVVGPLRLFVGGRIPIVSAGIVPNAVPVFGMTAVF